MLLSRLANAVVPDEDARVGGAITVGANASGLALENVSVSVAGTWLLRDVGLRVRPGELLAVIGPNGAGKSTLLRVLCGDLVPEHGRVTLEGRPLRSVSRTAQAKRRAVLPQESSLSFPFRAFEVALMGRSPHVRGAESAGDYSITFEAMTETQIAEHAERSYPTLSGGEKGRVQLARALAQIWEPSEESRYLFLDEPTNNLDLEHQHRALGSARTFVDSGVGVLAVLHDLNLAAQYADRIVMLEQGRVVKDGEPEAVLTAERLGRVFNIEVAVLRHPHSGRPLVVVSGAAKPQQQREAHHV